MRNLKMRAVLLLALPLLLPGCGPKQVVLQPGLLPVMPELPASARQGPTPPECLPKCLEAWKQKAEQWQRLLMLPEPAAERVSVPMME